jgi:hypothetical protein
MGNFDSHILLEIFVPDVKWENSQTWTWHQGHWIAYPVYPRKISSSHFVYPVHMIKTVKLRFRRPLPIVNINDIPKLKVTVYGKAQLEECKLTVERGLWGHDAQGTEFKIYNGIIKDIQSEGNRSELSLLITKKELEEGSKTNSDRTVVSIPTQMGYI